MYTAILWWIRLITALVLPFVIVIGSYKVALQFPGTVKLEYWESFSSFIFIVALVAVLWVIRQPSRFRSGRIVGGIFTTLLFLYGAFTMHVHATCDPIPPYIGGTVQSDDAIQGEQSANSAAGGEDGC